MENTCLKIDNALEKTFRTFKQNDHILYLYGIDEYCLGIWKNSNLEQKELLKITSILPVGIKINGCIFIYNENVYEDFDGLIEAEIEKLRELSCVNKERFYFLVLKDVLYLDDFEQISFEKQVLYSFNNKSSEENLDIQYNDFLQDLKKHYFLFNTSININFIKEDNSNHFKLNEHNKYSYFLKQSNFFIDDVADLNESKNNHLKEFLSKLNKNKDLKFNYLDDVTFEIHQLASDKSYKNLKEISLQTKNIEETLSTSYSLCGFINKNNGSIVMFLRSLLSTFTQQLELIISNLEQSKVILSNYFIFNEVFQNCPLIVTNERHLSNNTTKTLSDNIEKLIYLTTNSILNEENKYPFNAQASRLINVHTNVKREVTKFTKQFFVKGKYEYYHYGQDNSNDHGWGCAYRSLQTLASWFILNGISRKVAVPTINQIQETLVKIGDKQPKFIGSSEWIGAIDVSYVLGDLFGIECQIMNVMSGDELISKGREIANHFLTNGTPIMIGGGVYAYTIIGVEYDRVKGECMFLILDPHYAGEDDIKTIIGKGWCDWKKMTLFEKNNFYNLCLPLVPK